MRNIVLFLIIIATLVGSAGCNCGVPSTHVIKVDGSTTMYELSRTWANAFMRKNPGITVEVQKTGTTHGIESFVNGKCDIAETSRRLTAEELLRARKNGVRVEEYYVGFAVYAIAVNQENPVNELTVDQVRDIFLGKVSNWKDVGGKDMQIDVIWREIPPREYDFFLEKFVDVSDNIALTRPPSHIKILPTPKDIAGEIMSNPRAIGYLFLQDFTPGLKSLAIEKKGRDRFVKPTIADAVKGDYPILRPYYMYMDKDYKKPVKQFLQFIYSEDGLIIAKGMNFVPVPIKEGNVDRDVLFEFI